MNQILSSVFPGLFILSMVFFLFLLFLTSRDKITILQFLFLTPPVWYPFLVLSFPRQTIEFGSFLGMPSILTISIVFYGFYNLVFSLILMIAMNTLFSDFRKLVVELALILKRGV